MWAPVEALAEVASVAGVDSAEAVVASVAAVRRGAGDMAFLNETEKERISALIRQVESRTQGEIVTVIARQSDSYRYIPIMWAAIAALSVPGLYFLWELIFHSQWRYPGESTAVLSWLYPVQALTFLGVGMILQIPTCRVLVTPASVKAQRSSRHAKEQFFGQQLHLSSGRTGVLIFVSVAEHYVEIIVDAAIAAKVDNAVWDETIAEFIVHLKAGRIAEGFESTIEHLRDVLWEHFPAETGTTDELPNHLIEV